MPPMKPRWWSKLVCFVRGHDPMRLKWSPPRIICRRCLRLLE